MNRQELIGAVAADTGLGKAYSRKAIQAVFYVFTHAVSTGDGVQGVGSGAFSRG